jgi:hypothetical protein
MRCTLDLLIPVSRAHNFADFCGGRVNCSIATAEETGLVAVQVLPRSFARAHHALYHRHQICYERGQLVIVLEVPLQIHAAIIFVLRIYIFFKFPIPLQNFLALLERQPFRRNFL